MVDNIRVTYHMCVTCKLGGQLFLASHVWCLDTFPPRLRQPEMPADYSSTALPETCDIQPFTYHPLKAARLPLSIIAPAVLVNPKFKLAKSC